MSAATKQYAFRLSPDLVERIEAYAEKKAEPGRPCSRSDALRLLVRKALDQVRQEEELTKNFKEMSGAFTGRITDEWSPPPDWTPAPKPPPIKRSEPRRRRQSRAIIIESPETA